MTVIAKLTSDVEAAWPVISKVLDDAVKENDDNKLSQLVTVVERSADLSEHVTLGWSTDDAATSTLTDRALVAQADAIFELRAAKEIAALPLKPSPDSFKKLGEWAAKVRAGERRWVIHAIASTAHATGQMNPTVLDAIAPGSVVVAFGVARGLKEACEKRGLAFVPMDHGDMPKNCKVVVYSSDQFAAARLEDLSPAFDYVGAGITIVLSERIELFGDHDDNVKSFDSLDGFPEK